MAGYWCYGQDEGTPVEVTVMDLTAEELKALKLALNPPNQPDRVGFGQEADDV